MKKTLLGLVALFALNACQTTGSLQNGEVMGTDIGSILAQEARLEITSSEETKMNSEIDKALYFSDDGLTTRWYAGYNLRIRPIRYVRDRRDRVCRNFRHGYMIDGRWFNGSATACREHNVPWYLIANRWDRNPTRDYDRRTEPRWKDDRNKGNWENLSGELGSNPSDESFDDFGPRNKNDGW